MKSVPLAFSYALYLTCIIYTIFKLLERGTDKKKKSDVSIILFFFVYYFVSGLFYTLFSNLESDSWLIKDYLYSLLPILFYIVIRVSKTQINAQYLLFISWLTVLITDVIALVLLINPSFFRLFDQNLIEHEGLAFVLWGLGGVIQTGFLSLIGFAICLLSPIRLNRLLIVVSALFFVICVFLTGQRTPIGGVIIVFIIFLFRYRIKAVFPTIAVVSVFCILLPRLSKIEIQGVTIIETMSERMLNRFSNLEEGQTGRNHQYRIYNDDNLFEFVLGDGVGRHSQENYYSKTPLPDAMIFRIFNEMGIVGLIVFLLFFLINILRAIRTRNAFTFALVTYFFMANCFNRVLFTAPMSILPFVLMAYFNWNSISENNSTRQNTFLAYK